MTTFNIGVHVTGYAKHVNTEDGPIEVWQEQFEILAEAPRGNRYVAEGFYTENEAEAHSFLNALGDSNPETNPNDWVEVEPCYGSEAWGPEHEYALACFEADCYNEPRPRW